MKHALIRLREERRALQADLKSLGTSSTQEAKDLRAALRREIHETEEALDLIALTLRYEGRVAA